MTSRKPRTFRAVRYIGIVLALTFIAIPLTHLAGRTAHAAGYSPTGFTFQTVLTFTGNSTGRRPYAGVAVDGKGDLYGTTANGGNGPCVDTIEGCGTIFEIDASGKESILHAFTGGADGGIPVAGPVRDTLGNLYGTASVGGNTGCTGAGDTGCGVVYKVGSNGNFSVLYTFTGEADGATPAGSLLLDSHGNLYGTAAAGGSAEGDAGNGVVFKLDPEGNETVLYTFHGDDGQAPNCRLIADGAGNLYGTTQQGGNYACNTMLPDGCGVVFKLDPQGNETVLYAFAGSPDGSFPYRGVISDPQGNLYGTIEGGGINCIGGGCGTVYELTAEGKESVLFDFAGGTGYYPVAALLRDSHGNLYGTAKAGGDYDNGVIFRLTTDGRETVLYSFTGKTDGELPQSWLTPDGKGNFYGTTTDAGDPNCRCGTVYKVSVQQ